MLGSEVVAKIHKGEMRKHEILKLATRKFLENGYSNTHVKSIAKELKISPGNLTFHYPAKEDMLAELVIMLCRFQEKLLEKEVNEGYSSVMAVCLELATMAAVADTNEIIKDFYISSYVSPMCLSMIRKNDTERAKRVFAEYCPNWTHEDFAEAEIIVSGIEYATFMSESKDVPLESRIAGALNAILSTYCVPEELRNSKIDRVLSMDYLKIGESILEEFKEYVYSFNEHDD